MIETEMDSHITTKTRAKPRTTKSATFETAVGLNNMKKKVKRRRVTQKRREAEEEDVYKTHKEMRQLPLGPDSLQLMQQLHEDQRYDRPPRSMPDIAGIKSLSQYEAQSDVKKIQHQLTAFEACAGIKMSGKRSKVGDKDHRRLFLVDETGSKVNTDPLSAGLKNRRARPSGVIAPEEIVETIPAARRAVRITQRELRALKTEREDLERTYVRHRCTLLWQIGEMKRMQKQQRRVTRALSRKVVNTAKSLESSRRRTSALQDIMTELKARGNRILCLTREKSRLEAMLEAHNVELPEIDEVCTGDRVSWTPFGTGRVLDLRIGTRQLVVKMDFGGIGYIHEEDVEVLPSGMTFTETEVELKKRFFEKIGALVQPTGKLRVLNGGFDFTQFDSEEEKTSDYDSDEDSLSEEDTGATFGDDYMEDTGQRKGKKRRLIMTPTPGGSSKELKNRRVIEFPACTIPVVPYETGLLISPLSALPDRVAAVGPGAVQWLPSYLPKNMEEWEQERLSSLQMKGEIERLRYQLQKAEAQKLDAQQLASDQLESINQLVSQLDKLRDNAGILSGPSNSASTCETCSSQNAPMVKNSYHGKGGMIQRKDFGAKQDNSDDELSETNSKSSRVGDNDSIHSDARKASKRKHNNTESAEDETSIETNDATSAKTKAKTKPIKRSLRPRRKAATVSPKRK
ncbi:unnamed protein product [Peronospora belbahrii]|uniref:Uncharacterized protein n=1 Tax=Peronospora belbahrii TaxID=622444 RepID=A0AAU9KTD5_9STRA|nr:unnamed protein product [Peronospora belbahrii]